MLSRSLLPALCLLCSTACGSSTPPPRPTSPPPSSPAPEPEPEAPGRPLLSNIEKRTVTDLFDAINARDGKKVAGYFADNVATRDFGANGPEERVGREIVESAFASTFASFPDIQVRPTRFFQRSDTVIAEWISSFTPPGKANAKKAGIMGAYVLGFNDDGVIIRIDWYRDPATIAQQLGRAPGRFRPVPEPPSGEPAWIAASGGPEEESLVDVMKATWPESWSKHDRNAYAAAVTDGAFHADIATPNDYRGKAEILKAYDVYAKALPDMQVTIDRAWSFSPSYVVAEFTLSGTMEGNIGSFKATKKPFTIHGLDIDELDAGKIAKSWTYTNGNEFLGQVRGKFGGKTK